MQLISSFTESRAIHHQKKAKKHQKTYSICNLIHIAIVGLENCELSAFTVLFSENPYTKGSFGDGKCGDKSDFLLLGKAITLF